MNEVRNVSIDALSVILSTIGFGGIVYGFSVSGDRLDKCTGSWIIIVGLLAVILFAIRQMKMETPMLNLRAFKYPTFRSWSHYEFYHVLQYVINACYFTNVYANGFINCCIYNRSYPSTR